MSGEPSMVDEVAKAILRMRYGPAWASMHGLDHAAARAEARAAITTMRAATPAMVEAGRWPAEDDGPVACWRAMIDAALADPSDAR